MMRRFPRLALLASFAASCAPAEPPNVKLTYPVPFKSDVVDDYHGTKVADPYRWMEDLDAKETADWVAASNAVTEPYLAQLPLRQAFQRAAHRALELPARQHALGRRRTALLHQEHRAAAAVAGLHARRRGPRHRRS